VNSPESFLINLERRPCNVISRVAFGFSVPVFGAISGGSERVSTYLALFFGLLVTLRIVPLGLRRILPFSVKARQKWAERRNIAKRYDSYQWQKLFWIGLGQLLYAVIGAWPKDGELIAMLFCLIGGSAGLFFWRRANVPAFHEAT
jgi:hypothetical protein